MQSNGTDAKWMKSYAMTKMIVFWNHKVRIWWVNIVARATIYGEIELREMVDVDQFKYYYLL